MVVVLLLNHNVEIDVDACSVVGVYVTVVVRLLVNVVRTAVSLVTWNKLLVTYISHYSFNLRKTT